MDQEIKRLQSELNEAKRKLVILSDICYMRESTVPIDNLQLGNAILLSKYLKHLFYQRDSELIAIISNFGILKLKVNRFNQSIVQRGLDIDVSASLYIDGRSKPRKLRFTSISDIEREITELRAWVNHGTEDWMRHVLIEERFNRIVGIPTKSDVRAFMRQTNASKNWSLFVRNAIAEAAEYDDECYNFFTTLHTKQITDEELCLPTVANAGAGGGASAQESDKN